MKKIIFFTTIIIILIFPTFVANGTAYNPFDSQLNSNIKSSLDKITQIVKNKKNVLTDNQYINLITLLEKKLGYLYYEIKNIIPSSGQNDLLELNNTGNLILKNSLELLPFSGKSYEILKNNLKIENLKSNKISHMTNTSDGGFILINNDPLSKKFKGLYVTKYSSDGTKDWEKIFNDIKCGDVIVEKNNYFYIIGEEKQKIGNQTFSFGLCNIKLDKKGNFIGKKNIKLGEKYFQFWNAFKTRDNNFIILGKIQKKEFGSDAFILKIDPNQNNILWSKVYKLYLSGTAFKASESKNGNILINIAAVPNNPRSRTLILNSQGQVLYDTFKKFGFHLNTIDKYFVQPYLTSDGNYLDSKIPYTDYTIKKQFFDYNGKFEEIWTSEKYYDMEQWKKNGYVLVERLYNKKEINNEYYASTVALEYNPEEKNPFLSVAPFITKFDSNGTIVWKRLITSGEVTKSAFGDKLIKLAVGDLGGNFYQTYYDILKINDKNFYIYLNPLFINGRPARYESLYRHIIKMDINGNILWQIIFKMTNELNVNSGENVLNGNNDLESTMYQQGKSCINKKGLFCNKKIKQETEWYASNCNDEPKEAGWEKQPTQNLGSKGIWYGWHRLTGNKC